MAGSAVSGTREVFATGDEIGCGEARGGAGGVRSVKIRQIHARALGKIHGIV